MVKSGGSADGPRGNVNFNARTLDWFMNDPVWYKLVMQGRLFMREHRPLRLRLQPLTPAEMQELSDFVAQALDTPIARRRRLAAIA